EGEAVKSGEAIAEIETDKATMEMEIADDGVLGMILVPAGTAGVKVNTPIALLLEEGEDKSALAKVSAPKAAPAPTPPSPPPPPKPAPAQPAAAPPSALLSAPAPKAGRVAASPLARRLAKEAGVDIARIAGSGPHGRIVRRDVEAVALGKLPMLAQVAVPAGAKAPTVDASMPFTEVPNTSFRKAVARRLAEAKREIPHFYLNVDCELDALLKLRADLNARAPEGEGAYKLSVNDFIIRAVALGLRKVPAANATWTDEAIRLYHNVDISVAVATPMGLITPVIRRADTKGLAEISREIKALAERARAGKLKPEEYSGGGFTISNLGMYGIKSFSAIINPPQSCILAVGAGEQRAVVRKGALAIASVMTCTLSVDHRSVDGAVGAEFLAAFKPMIEDPTTMLL
ncbi:MAG: pyruvate dehydrogenase complex dihydrolipoamide acetyltransferase, partial [Pseudomonadota bacterium]